MSYGFKVVSFLISIMPILGQNQDYIIKGGADHPCYRSCYESATPMHCVYNFTITKHSTMSLDCGKCPFVREDCLKPRCITGGGLVRTVITVNTMIPGPQILVCEKDIVTVNVKNNLRNEAVTIHWHGIHHKQTPFMDGVPWITQLPIAPYTTFTYNFTAEPHGTHFWHGHSGFHEADGLFGLFTVGNKEPTKNDKLYDYDLPEHSIIIWHWYDQPTQEVLLPILQRNESVFGYGFLINGKASFKKYTQKERLGQIFTTPKEVFRVKKGFRYRFRVVYNAAIYCPIQLSIDDHKLIMIAGDTTHFEAVEVDSFMLGAGDRFDFILNATAKSDCYWMRMRAFGDCDENKSSVHAEALLCYDNVTINDQKEHSYEEANRPGVILNPAEIATRNYNENKLIKLVDLNNLEIDNLKNYSRVPNETIFIQIHSRPYENIPYPGPWHQFDNVSFRFPGENFLKGQLNTNTFCSATTKNETCLDEFCSCTYLKEIEQGSLVEVVLVDISYNRNQDHPVHLHGNNFFIIAMGTNKTIEELKNQNEQGLINKKLKFAPARDSISVPNRGYAIIRFIANNIGYWMFHCHLTNHMEMGMAMIFQVGTKKEILSKCRSYPEQCKDWYKSSSMTLQVPLLLYFCIILFNVLLRC
ncbi:laccase-2-like [Cimex lectularius]|uniref:Multicopper oxidase n=1 Tax=Cimex lectularius TaxID=79782 RepID=A0A8I6SBX9_CIMLE|nr:laccase-2-like [Cimex lectularius]XP_024080885.1 laccase-2-like [Cimex lectularius]